MKVMKAEQPAGPHVNGPSDGWVKPLSVREKLEGKQLLVTGCSGFIGKVFIGLLLDRVPEIRRIILLARPKKGKGAKERVSWLFERSPAFRHLREKHEEGLGDWLRERVLVVEGDVRYPHLGLSAFEAQNLAREIDAVIHVAGETDFEPDPIEAIAINTKGALHAQEFARMSRGKRLLHVSTAFVAGMVSGRVEERIRRGISPNGTPFDPWDELHAIESLCASLSSKAPSPHEARKQRITYVSLRARSLGWPNIYTYTKGLAEHLVAGNGDVATCLVRPSIVESAREIPFSGWNEGVNTSAPIVWLVSTMHRHLPVASQHIFDVVPVDTAARGILLALAELMGGEHAPVYHLASGDTNPFTFGRAVDLTSLARRRQYGESNNAFERWVLRHLDSVPSDTPPSEDLTLSLARAAASKVKELWSNLDIARVAPRWTNHKFGEFISKVAQQQSKQWSHLARTLAQVESMLERYQPFIFDHNYVFVTEEIRRASQRLEGEEKESLGWDVENIDWRDYWMNVQIPGLDRWSLPLLRGERVPDDPELGLGISLECWRPVEELLPHKGAHQRSFGG
ncbi:MAG: SDR family oxidoreductase [Sandaracinaceae bacterium]|nr:SDR family oxidoreductase [Sandaracinaceae bacterium]